MQTLRDIANRPKRIHWSYASKVTAFTGSGQGMFSNLTEAWNAAKSDAIAQAKKLGIPIPPDTEIQVMKD